MACASNVETYASPAVNATASGREERSHAIRVRGNAPGADVGIASAEMWRFLFVALGGLVILVVLSWEEIVAQVMEVIAFLTVAFPTTIGSLVVLYVVGRLLRGALLERRLHIEIEAYKRELVWADQHAATLMARRQDKERQEQAQREEALRSLFSRRDETS